jgi:type I restriction enzyme S subunit
MNGDLPEGWTAVALEELLLPGGLFDGPFGSNLKTSDYAESGVRVVRLENLGYLQFVPGKRTFISPAKYASLIRHRVCEGDIIFGSFVDGDVRVCILPPLDSLAVAKADCFCIRSNEDLVDRRFLAYYFATPRVRNALIDQIHGATRPRINTSQLRQLDILLPPHSEQQRIARRLVELLGKVQTSRARLDNIPDILKRFRQAVLAAACTGRLSADWRSKHGNIENAKSLLARLSTATPEPYLDAFERSSEEELPASWVWVPLGGLGRLNGGGTPAKENAEFWGGTIPWVSPKDMKRDRIADSEDHITRAAVEHSSTKEIPAGSILFVVRGMILNHTLPTAITERTVTLNQDMKGLTPDVSEMSEYLFIASKHIARAILFEVKEATHGTRRIETPLLRNWAVPLPPLEEQAEIVRRVSSLMSFADRLESRFGKAKAQVDKLTHSILAKAFRGEIVPTEADLAKSEGRAYETAEQLLARIKSSQVGKTHGRRSSIDATKNARLRRS